jgi:hypothetical protein
MMTIQDAAFRVIDTLERLVIDYMLVGSISSMFYSFPRSTSDVDFLIATPEFAVVEFAKELGPDFQLNPQLSFETFGGSLKHELTVLDSAFRVELPL